MRLVHRGERSEDSPGSDDDDREPTVLADDVDVARSTLEQGRGLMFRRSIPDGYALVFPFDGVDARWLHMVFVPFAIDALWVVDGEVQKRARLAPFVGLGRAQADTVVELPAGAAAGVAVGDEVRLVE
ncbi:MAG: DUF192 domain-containing protein [Halorubrum sp.]|uniref:DUF192 domain-containing protein n=1 Tax=Halorubrum sp. TaxID=1879286 RepID=UPI003970CEA0